MAKMSMKAAIAAVRKGLRFIGPKRDTRKIKYLVIHHSTDEYDLEWHKAYHMVSGLGYHGMIQDPDGDGPKKAEYMVDTPENEISNGVGGANTVSLNFCVIGDFQKTHPTEQEIHMLVQVLAAKCRQYKLDPYKAIQGHYWMAQHIATKPYTTACPGVNLIARLPEIRRRVAAYL